MAYSNNTLCGIFHNQALHYGKRHTFLRAKFDNEGRPTQDYRDQTWDEVRSQVFDLARGLIKLGLKKGDRAAIFSESRPRWIIADQAIQACRAIGVPLYPTLSEDELAYMLSDSGTRIAIVSDQKKAETVLRLKKDKKDMHFEYDYVVTMGPWEGERPDNVLTLNDVMDIGRKEVEASQVKEGISSVKPDDIASIIYTSGTTGRPKGVILTHTNWVSNIKQCTNSTIITRVRDMDLHLINMVHLPLCHVYGRTIDYHVGGLHLGGILAFAEDFQKLPQNILEIRPNVIATIPRFFEKTYEFIKSSVSRQKEPYRKTFEWALRTGKKFTECMATGKKMKQIDMIQFALANVLVFNKIRKLAGFERLAIAASGGGKLSEEVCVFFRSLGIQISEGYGLTETSPVINFNEPEFLGLDLSGRGKLYSAFIDKMIDWTVDAMVRQQAEGKSPYAHPISSLKLSISYNTVAHRLIVKPGTVGRPVLWTEEKIAPDGEILVKGPQVFMGYWNLPDETKEAFTEDGWFKTGDIGEFDEDGFLKITDRKKELFVTAGGKNIAPHPIELMLTVRPYIEQACLTGDGRKYITALIVPDFQKLKRYAKEKGIDNITDSELVKHPDVYELIKKQVDEVNSQLSSYEQVKYFKILDRPFSVDTGELTPTLKIKRRMIKERYADLIDSMYE
ncbi:MAG: long-chain fatty acid--CoA ligase [Deltaproteobacteria bacterium]|nr:long-chain fatty acid--CoA ligase [Deltaproteobacteria bacterium]